MQLSDIRLFMVLAEWVWSTDPSPHVSPEICLNSIPFLSWSCFSRLLVKAVGIAIICGAFLNKAPIFVNILKTNSVAGLSTGAIYGETIMYSNAAFYGILRGNPITAWGENGAITLQSIALVYLLWKFKDDPMIPMQQRAIALAVYAGYAFGALLMLPPEWYYWLQASNWPVLVYSRGSQILETFRVKHTGTQSIVTISMNLMGSAIRILTTIKEVGWDLTLLSGYTLSIFLNFIMWTQFVFYRKNTKKFMSSLAQKKKE